MKLTDYALGNLVDIVRGEENRSAYKTGSQLVALFNKYGQRDRYDSSKGGLPILDGREQNSSRKDYTFDRLTRLNNSQNIKGLLEDICNDESCPNKEHTVTEINTIIVPEGFKIELFGDQYELIGAEDDEEVVDVKVSFEDIQNEILKELENARFLVWVAVAWFTNISFFKKLVELKQKGVNIQVLIVDDEINNTKGCPIESEFESQRIPLKGYYRTNKMHNKFCIIDLQTVINGSYNWTNAAEYNDENITIIRNRKITEKFAEQFINLKITGIR